MTELPQPHGKHDAFQLTAASHSWPAAHARADLHLHSNYSCDVPDLPQLSPRALYDRALARGMSFFTLTDHETMRGITTLQEELARQFGDQLPIPVIPGVELKVHDREIGHTVHVNVLGLSPQQMNRLIDRRRCMTAFLDYCRREDLYHAYNHPFWFESGERGSLPKILNLMREFPVLELNGGNQMRTAKQLGIGSATLYRKLKKYGSIGKSPNGRNMTTKEPQP